VIQLHGCNDKELVTRTVLITGSIAQPAIGIDDEGNQVTWGSVASVGT